MPGGVGLGTGPLQGLYHAVQAQASVLSYIDVFKIVEAGLVFVVIVILLTKK